MLRKTIHYVDYNEEEQVEDFYFNLSKAELMELEFSTTGGIQNLLKSIINSRNVPEIMAFLKKIVLLSYGEKSLDGKRFEKSETLSKKFSETEAYSELMMELLNAEKAAEFVNGILPKGFGDTADKIAKENKDAIEKAKDLKMELLDQK